MRDGARAGSQASGDGDDEHGHHQAVPAQRDELDRLAGTGVEKQAPGPSAEAKTRTATTSSQDDIEGQARPDHRVAHGEAHAVHGGEGADTGAVAPADLIPGSGLFGQ
ncbi:hypothetical protein [Streptomyces sp. H-KF8]|uniref:hypothetical protein n=1 Tax=Streptomyces sp. H-KF8 TaxID=1727216 RepID=UPI001331B598|nr:hypothetical protein [Streptomyces sp. H-KF8]